MRKLFAVLAIAFLFASLLVPLVSAAYVCPAATDGGASTVSRTMYGTGFIYAEAFTANSTGYIYNATFYMGKTGSPTGHLVSKIYSTVGTVGTNAIPNGAALTNSYERDIETEVYDVHTNVTFIFSGDYELQASTVYAITVEIVDGTTNAGNQIDLGTPTSTYAAGNRAYYSTSWVASPADIFFIINGDTTEYTGATPTPTPTATPSSGSGDADMEALTAAILPFLVPLLVCLIPALLGYKFVGELGFFIGLNVGVILAYVTLAGTAYAFPLWGIILVGVMDVAVVLMRR